MRFLFFLRSAKKNSQKRVDGVKLGSDVMIQSADM